MSQADSEAVLAVWRGAVAKSVDDPAQADVQVRPELSRGPGEAERSLRQLARRLAAHGRPVVVAGPRRRAAA